MPIRDQSASADSMFAERAVTTVSERPRSNASQINRPSAAKLRPRSTFSTRLLISAREGIYDDVHAEARVVDGREALVVGVIIPLRAVVLVAVENPDSIATHHCLEMLVDQIVAPAVQLVAGRRRSIIELEESIVQGMRVREIDGCRERPCHLLHRRLVKDATDVVVVIVEE